MKPFAQFAPDSMKKIQRRPDSAQSDWPLVGQQLAM
jgi:hypothetical protein